MGRHFAAHAQSVAGLIRGLSCPAESNASWFVILTRARQERILVAELAAAGLAVYLPLTRERRVYAGRAIDVERPAMARIVFLHADEAGVEIVRRSGRVIRVARVEEQVEFEELFAMLPTDSDSSAGFEPVDQIDRRERMLTASTALLARGVRSVAAQLDQDLCAVSTKFFAASD
jgi:hypothetical protein